MNSSPAPSHTAPSFLRASVGFLSSTTLLALRMVLLASFG
jgi:hypothetical protein